MKKFACIDYELANHHFLSACQLGVITFNQGVLEDKVSYHIRPPQQHGHFIQEFMEIHHIKPQQVQDAPSFIDLWKPLSGYFDQAVLCAHNAPFDMKIMTTLASHYDIKLPEYQYFDTVKIAQRIFPFLPNHKLNTIAKYLHIKHQHHDATSDALAASQIVLYAMSATGSDDVFEVCRKLRVPIKTLYTKG